MPLNENSPTGVLLMTMGDPSSVSGVFPFLVRLFSDPAIIRAPWFVRYPLSLYIALKKLRTMLGRYRAIGGGSPMNDITKRQAGALEKRLAGHGSFKVYIANRYCKPDTRDAYRQIKADRVKKLVVLPLYPQFSTATTGSGFDALKGMLGRDGQAPETVYVTSFSSDTGYVAAFSAKIREALDTLPEEKRAGAQILFSAHSLPHEFVKQGDPYLDEIRNTLAGTLKAVKPLFFHLCFQSKGGGKREWLMPETDVIIRDLALKGRDTVVIVPVSFVAENIETLYDVNIMYRKLAGEAGIRHFVRVKCLDDDPAFIDALTNIVLNKIRTSAA
jgi:ferrochelatase